MNDQLLLVWFSLVWFGLALLAGSLSRLSRALVRLPTLLLPKQSQRCGMYHLPPECAAEFCSFFSLVLADRCRRVVHWSVVGFSHCVVSCFWCALCPCVVKTLGHGDTWVWFFGNGDRVARRQMLWVGLVASGLACGVLVPCLGPLGLRAYTVSVDVKHGNDFSHLPVVVCVLVHSAAHYTPRHQHAVPTSTLRDGKHAHSTHTHTHTTHVT